MASLPIVPTTTALTIGGLAVTGLVAYMQTLRTRIESQNLENYRIANGVAADLTAGSTPAKITNRVDRTA